MTTKPSVLELASLPERHPGVGEALLHIIGIPAIVRLRIDPVALPADRISREISLFWRSPATNNKEEE